MTHIDFYYDNGKTYSARRVESFYYDETPEGILRLNYTQVDKKKESRCLSVRTISTVLLEDVHTLVFHSTNEYGMRDIIVRRLKPSSVVDLTVRKKPLGVKKSRQISVDYADAEFSIRCTGDYDTDKAANRYCGEIGKAYANALF